MNSPSSGLHSRKAYVPELLAGCTPRKGAGRPVFTDPDEEIEKVKNELKEARKQLVLYRSPFKTVFYFLWVVADAFKYIGKTFAASPVFKILVVPLCIAWLVGNFFPGDHTQYVQQLNKIAEFVVWWLGLGILSSVGLGSGMHSGILFLFPHTIAVVLTAQKCKSLNFESFTDMWWMKPETLWTCPATETQYTFFEVFMKLFLPALLWGAGTAIGEIPPYAISYHAKQAGLKNEEFEELQEDAEGSSPFGRMVQWTMHFLEKWGFWGVLAFSAWPNAAFDMCGVCCGHFMMPFWTFFSAVFIGKALIKVNGQVLVLIVFFTETYFQKFMALLKAINFTSYPVDEILNGLKNKWRDSFSGKSDDNETSLIKDLWGYLMLLLIGSFAVSCVHQLAQNKAADLDQKKVKVLTDKKAE